MVLAAVLALGVAACAPQQETRPASVPVQGAGASQGMQGHDMSGMSMSAQMAHCTEMRQQGANRTPEMQRMLAHCDQMSHSPGMQRRQ